MAYTDIDKSDDYFTTFLWTGDGTSPKSFTGVGFQADMMWSKIRTDGHQHNIVDTVRGVNQRLISTNLTNAEDTTCTHGHFDSLDSDGFTITGAGGYWNVNTNAKNYVGWLWKANGAGVSNTAGDITSTVSASTTSGFSIVSFDLTGQTGVKTVGHGLGTAPKVVITKRRSGGAGDWTSYFGAIGNSYLVLNSTGASATNAYFMNNTAPTSSLFTVGDPTWWSQSPFIAYCFAEKKGFSKFGSYTGNGSTDGTFVYTGFKPAFVMLKSSSNAGTEWVMHDIKRSLFNPVNDPLLANSPGTESVDASWSPVDFLSNGFKLRTTDTWLNGSGYTYIYMAFAENPFVTSTSIPTTAR
jgi:hypothetical protein